MVSEEDWVVVGSGCGGSTVLCVYHPTRHPRGGGGEIVFTHLADILRVMIPTWNLNLPTGRILENLERAVGGGRVRRAWQDIFS